MLVNLIDFGMGLIIGGMLMAAVMWVLLRPDRHGLDPPGRESALDHDDDAPRRENHRTMWD